MLTKTIKHKDVDNNDTETVAYFNLTKAECLELNIRADMDVIGKSKDNNQIMDAFRRIMRLAYGVRTGDGQFLKVLPSGVAAFDAFSTTEAYSELFMELFTDPEYGATFINSILPPEIANPDGQQSQADVPSHLANHPSMQGRRAARESAPQERRQAPTEEAPVIYQTPEFETEQELADFEAWKASRGAQAPQDRVSPPEENPGQTGAPVSPDLY